MSHPRLLTVLSTFVVSVLASAPLLALDLSLTDHGVRAAVKGMGEKTVSYPMLQPGDLKPLTVAAKGKHADVTYANGITAGVDLKADGVVEIRFKNMSESVTKFHLGMMVGPEYCDGGTWQMAGGETTPFPAQKPEKPFLFQGNASGITITDVAGRSLTISGLPDFAFNQVQDNREWGWKIFQWQVWVPYNRGWEAHTFRVTESVPAVIEAQIDRFGQTTRKNFPDKVSAEEDLVADRNNEAAYYASLKPRETDRFGGIPGTKEKLGFTATGFFHTEKKGDRWYLVNPDGNATIHLGICTFNFGNGEDATDVTDRRDIFAWLPPNDGEFSTAWHPENWWHDRAFSFYAANVIRKYGAEANKEVHLGRLIDRVRAMGFNAIGAFTGNNPAFTKAAIPRVEHIGFGPALPGVRGVPDPFDTESVRTLDEKWSKQLPAMANDPLIVGYFFANEQGLEDIPRAIPQLSGKHAAKRKLVEMLQQKYATIADFNTAWGVSAKDFATLADQPLPVSTKDAFSDMHAYTEVFLDTYYRVITETCRKYDPNHLMMGNRWQPGTANSEVLCRIAGKYMDVISINYYTLGIDRAFIERLHQWTGGKPQMWSEYYYTSGVESNASGSGVDMATQRERGQAYRQYVEQGTDLGFVIGFEWFTLIDQAATGRWFEHSTGERNNTGIFNVADRPYKDLVAEMAIANNDIYDVLLNGKKPYVLDDPRFTGAGRTTRKVQAGRVAKGSMVIDGNATGWPGRPPERIASNRVVSGKDGKGLEAAFKTCWDEENLYILVNVVDATPMNNRKSGDHLWAGDGIELFIGSEDLDKAGAFLFSDRQILLGAKPEGDKDRTFMVNVPQQPKIAMAVVPSVDGSGYTIEAAIPWSSLSTTAAENKELIFDLAIDDAPEGGDRTRQLMWNGGAKNSADRSYWGRLTLVP